MVRRYSGDELHGFMHPDYLGNEPRWVDGKDYDRLFNALTAICDGNTMRIGGRTKWTLADVIQEHYKIAGNALEGLQ